MPTPRRRWFRFSIGMIFASVGCMAVVVGIIAIVYAWAIHVEAK